MCKQTKETAKNILKSKALPENKTTSISSLYIFFYWGGREFTNYTLVRHKFSICASILDFLHDNGFTCNDGSHHWLPLGLGNKGTKNVIAAGAADVVVSPTAHDVVPNVVSLEPLEDSAVSVWGKEGTRGTFAPWDVTQAVHGRVQGVPHKCV